MHYTPELLAKLGPPKWPLREGKNAMLLARIYVRHQRDHLMRAAANVMNSHRRRLELGLKGNLTATELQDIWDYMEKLRAIPEHPEFPHNVEFPRVPEVLHRVIVE